MIVQMALEHLQGVMLIELDSFRPPWSHASMLGEMFGDNNICLVALDGGSVMGYVTAARVGDEAHIHRIGVKQSERRKGIASALTERCIEVLKSQGCRTVYLEVRASNTAAIELYRKSGFRLSGRRNRYYSHPEEDAVLMIKVL